VVVVVVDGAQVLAHALPARPEVELGLAVWARRSALTARITADAGVVVVEWDTESPFELLVRRIEARRRARVGIA